MSKAKVVLDVIRQRRSVYPQFFIDREISKSILEVILEAANWAPTHKRTEPWRFYVFTEESKQQLGKFLQNKIMEMYPPEKAATKGKKAYDKCKQAAAIIAITYHRDEKESVPVWEEIAATAMSVQNMWLACHSLNIGTYWSSTKAKQHLHKHIEMPDSETCLGFMYLGYHRMPDINIQRTSMKEKVTWI